MNLLYKLFGSVLAIMAPLQVALLVFLFFKFRLIYLTHDKGRTYQVAVFLKMVSAFALLAFLNVTSLWVWMGLLTYFGADALLAFDKYRARTKQAVAESAVTGGRRYDAILSENYLKWFVPFYVVAILAVYIAYNRSEINKLEQTSTTRFNIAEKSRAQTLKNVKTIAERAGEFITLCTEYITYQVRVNQMRDIRMERIEKAVGVKAEPYTITVPQSIDTLIEKQSEKGVSK